MLGESPTLEPSDEDLAHRVRDGCTASFEALARRYQVPLLHFLRQRTSIEDAEDIVQDTLIRAFRKINQYQTTWRFSTWLFTIARRMCVNHRRRKHPVADSEAVEASKATTRSPHQALVAEERRKNLWELASAILTEEQNTALWLHYVEDMPMKDIAQVLDRSTTSVKTMLFRARQKLLPPLQANIPSSNRNGMQS